MSKTRLCVIFLLCVVAVSVAVSVFTAAQPTNAVAICVTPNGERSITLEYGEAYTDEGATAILRTDDREAPLEVTTHGKVDTAKVGTYLIRYEAKHGRHYGTGYRRVTVVDTKAPEITLVSDPEITLLPTEEYVEEGYSARDDYDGDLTDRVRRVVRGGQVIYTVSDSSGNTTRVVRSIPYVDPNPPVLTLQGKQEMTIGLGSAYREPGVTAMDDVDGDITLRVSVTGTVNTAKAGRYALTYTVADDYGNTASVNRYVFVKDPSLTYVNDPAKEGKVIYLTFDDGPGPYTNQLLDTLGRYNVPATFFVVNTSYISTVKRAAAEGHTIAIHSATHKFDDIYASEEAFFEDLYTMQGIIREHTGQTATIIRFPGGSSNTISSFNKGIMTRLAPMVEEKGFTYVDWNVDSKDAGGAKDPEQVFKNVTSRVEEKEFSVVLLHDIKDYSVEAVEALILWGLDNGYVFRALTPDSPICHHDINN